jgi:hypothetical protein
MASPGTTAIDLYWLPLGAGGHSVRWNGRIFEWFAARHAHRDRCDLCHSALEVRVPEGRFVIEQAPAWSESSERGVVAEGAVGTHAAGRFRLFRYEIRCWRDGVIPDVAEAVESPQRLSADPDHARQLLELVRQVPTPVWGRDELRTGEMWNSNSLISWLITRSDLDVDSIHPPAGGRAPGWRAGVVVARRQLDASVAARTGSATRRLTMATQERQVLRSVAEILLASPQFVTAPLIRRQHLRWGATDAEVAAPMPGDELVPRSSFTATRAITIDAPPEAVWPWLVQLGYRRAGWYTYDLFDNAGYPSADRILLEHQDLKVGDWVPMAKTVNDTTAFRVAGMEPNRWMLWQKPNSTWAWKLIPLDGDRTRLITRLKDLYGWRTSPGNALLSLILFELGDFPMTRKLLLGVKRRAEEVANAAAQAGG